MSERYGNVGFGGVLEDTNLSGLGGKPFVTKVPDGSYLVDLGNDDAFEDPIGWVDPDDSNDRPGRLFIHELTHVWDVRRASSPFRWIAEAGSDAMLPAAVNDPYSRCIRDHIRAPQDGES